MKLLGPFSQAISCQSLPEVGPISDNQFPVIQNAGLVIEGDEIKAIGAFSSLRSEFPNAIHEEIEGAPVLTPGLIDTHTHICFAGSRAKDYSLRVAGSSYLEIAKQGGGILDTVQKTREASFSDLEQGLKKRCTQLIQNGVTTAEVKSGYGLTVDDELKMLECIQSVGQQHMIDLVASCLAAHVKPKEFASHKDYLEAMATDLLPQVWQKNLAKRVDIFVEEGAFTESLSKKYLQKARDIGFSLVVHADQFSVGGSRVACDMKALSADHLEVSTDVEMKNLAQSGVIATVLPGASMGLGLDYAPARKLLDHGCSVVIASDWNPGSAPMGYLLLQAAVLGAEQKLSMAETWAAITCRAAKALEQNDRGILEVGKLADFLIYPTNDYRDILYHQGQMQPVGVYKRGEKLS